MPNPFGFAKNPNAAKEAAVARARDAAAAAKGRPTAGDAVLIKYVSPSECTDRIRVVFDESGSMYAHYKDAKEGTVEFFRNCIPNQTACAVHMLETPDTAHVLDKLQSNLPALGTSLLDFELNGAGTPLFEKMDEVIQLDLTRMIAFTDGSPNSQCGKTWFQSADIIIEKAVAKKVPIDTVFFGGEREVEPIKLLKYFAEKTGGYFLHFDPKKVNFRTAFKYLAPVNRLMLASESVRREIESGKRA